MFGIPSYLIYLLLAAGCGSTASTSSTGSNQDNKYTEDLSVWRPKTDNTTPAIVDKPANQETPKVKPYVEPQYASNKKIDVILDSIDRYNLSRKYVDGFTIQVYSGKREDAINAKKQLVTMVPEVPAEVQFHEPIFRVKAGKYFTRLDAQRDFLLIRKHFPAAIIIPDKIITN